MVAWSQHSKRNSAPHYGFGDGFSHGVPGEVFSRNRSNKEEDAMKNNKLCLAVSFVLTCGIIHAGNVVTDWNAIASTTIVTNGAKSPGASAVWFAYTSEEHTSELQSLRHLVCRLLLEKKT